MSPPKSGKGQPVPYLYIKLQFYCKPHQKDSFMRFQQISLRMCQKVMFKSVKQHNLYLEPEVPDNICKGKLICGIISPPRLPSLLLCDKYVLYRLYHICMGFLHRGVGQSQVNKLSDNPHVRFHSREMQFSQHFLIRKVNIVVM